MAVQVNPVTPSLPATTAIQDPAARRFAQAVADSIRTAQTPEYAIQQLSTAAAGLFSGATPPAITQWLVSSELYQQLSAAIGRVDSAAQLAVAEERAARIQDIADEALARANEIVNAIAAESAARALDLANEAAARAADLAAEANARTLAIQAEASARTLAVQGEADARAAGLLAEAAARGTAISNEATERQSADQGLAQSIATVTATVASNTAAIQEEQTARANADTAESSARQALATRVTSAENSITSQAAQINDRYTKAATDSAISAATTALTAGYQAGDAGVLSSAQALVASEESARSSAIVAEASARETLASQMRGSYTGNDLGAVTTGLLYQERIARSTAVDGLAQQITLLSAGAGEQFDYQKIWYFDSGAEGWTGNGTPTVSNGWIRPADHGSDPYIVSPTGIAAPGSTYPQVRLRIRKTGSPTWAGVLWWRTSADSTWDAARSATLAEPTYDGNGIGLVTANLVWTGTIDRIRLDLSTEQAAGSGFEVDWVAIGRPSPGASNAALLEEQLARANADAVEVTARESLSTKLTGAANPASLTLATLSAGLLFDERQARSSADATEVTARQSLSTKLAGAADPASLTLATLSSGLLFDERQARSTADATEVTARQALSAKLTGFNDPSGKSLADLASGLIFEEKTARVSQDTALASSITTLTGRVGATESAITAEQTARANDDAAEVTARQALSTKITGAANPASLTLATLSTGLLYDERQARSSADATEVTARQALSAKLTGFNDPTGKTLVDLSSGLLFEEKTARAAEDLALASSITTLTGRVGAAEGAIVSEQTARANADSAIATSINGLSAQFGGNLTYSVLRQWEFASTVEGWVAGAATATVSNGILTWTTTGANPYISFAFATADRYMGSVASKIRARVRRTAGSQAWEGNCYYTTAAHGETTSYRKTIAAPANPAAWTILEWDMSALTAGGSDYTANEIRGIRLDLVGTAGDTWQIDWISVGERVVSPAALDAQENKAAITAEETARANADGVLATSISTLRSQIGVTEGGALTTGLIQSEKTARASNDNAIVSAVNTALAQITGVSTSISQSGENLIASWSQAQASKWSQIESEVLTAGGQTIRAALAQESNTRSTLAGQVSSTWMVRAQIDSGTGKPYIAGIALGAEGQNGGATSEFIVQADKFVMTMPGLGGYVPFAIGPTGAEFTGLTNWSNVQGATKPQDGATRNVFRGAWTTSTAYVLGDIVLKDGNGWSCLVAHTAASGNQPPSSGGGNTWWTLYAVKGADGANAIVAVLSNESHVIPTDSAGNNGNYSGAATTITIYNGTSNDSANWTVTATTSNVSGSLSGKTYTVSGLSADTGYVDLTATRSGYASVVKRFVLSKSKAGTAGAQGPAVVVTSSRATTFTATDGVLDGSQADIVLTASVSGVTSPTYAWTFSGLQSNPVASTTNTQTITAAQFGTAKSATVTCTVNGAYKDQVTLVRLEKSTAAAGATVGSNLADPFSTATWYPGHHTFETVSDGKVGSLVLRLNTGLSNPEQIRYIPLDRTKKYRVRFWARPQAGANGTLYFTLRQYISPGVFGPGNTGLSPYKPESVTPGVHNTNFGTDTWGEYSYIWTTADWQTGVTLVRPLFLRNYGGTVGYWEVQDLRFEEVTEVEAAKDSAAAANALLADIAADSKLTPAEKKSVRKEWDAIYAERAGIRAQADSFGITTEKTNYDNKFQALGTYLNGGTAYTIDAIPPSWVTDANLSTTTTIVGATFRANWSSLYADRQTLLNKISSEAGKRADWATITGSGKPENGATVGADFGRFNVTSTILNEQFASGFTGWVNRSGNGEITAYNNPSNPYGSTDGKYVYFGDFSGDDQVWAVRTAQLFPYDPNKLYRMRVRCRQAGGSGDIYIGFEGIAADGTTYVTWDGQSSWGSQHYFVASEKKLPAVDYTDPNTWTELVGYVKGSAAQSDLGEFPSYSNPCRLHANVKYFRPVVIANYNYQPGYFDLDYVIIEEGTVDPGNLNGQISAGNITTYIANAAIGNAQIGGDIWSSNFAAGSDGWRIYRSGSAEFRNVTARGDIEATSIKASAANIVNTLNVAGDAITAPLAGSIEALTVNQTVLNTYTYSRTLGTITTSDQGRGQVLVLITPYRDEPLAQAFTSSDYSSASVTTKITRNGISIFETTASGALASTDLKGAVYLDTPGAGVTCTYAVETYTYKGAGSAQFSQSHRIAKASFFIMEFKK